MFKRCCEGMSVSADHIINKKVLFMPELSGNICRAFFCWDSIGEFGIGQFNMGM